MCLLKAFQRALVGLALLAGPLLWGQSGQDHTSLVNGPFRSGPEVTKACLECHQGHADDFMKTVHWNWSSRQKVNGKDMDLGKKNAINNFCLALPSNYARCTSCHAGYGWKDASFDFSKAENIDCLVCHDTTGTYKKFPTAAGNPVLQDMEWPKGSGKLMKAIDLDSIAKKVGKTSRATCGSCHFYGGGGDHVKHGDLDSSLLKPSRERDVHMAAAGPNMSCTACHKSERHQIPGKALSVSVSGGGQILDCSTCHAGAPHKKNPMLNKHMERVACQTCHIPTFSRDLPTKVWWDWSTAGKDQPVGKDANGMPLYDKMKGDFRWSKDVRPTYLWFNGSVDRYLLGDLMKPGQVTYLNRPKGERADKSAKLTPFKVMQGRQPYDTGSNMLISAKLFGGYWNHFDWVKASADGMKEAGLPFTGKVAFTDTKMFWKVNHMVVPKGQALKCGDCHSAASVLDWKALGYPGDPRKGPKR
ncbi:MAG: tetrathionate reductase family octaheme c-type cytochrome [Holophaga sp.]|nr:tetrathionate reductase family octaheme c-type cytochrome [Holophaga sp.]